MSLPVLQNTTRWICSQLEELGYRDGEDISIRVINGEGDWDLIRSEVNGALAQNRPDLVLSVATLASRSVREILADSDVPQLFALVADPVAEGFTAALGEPSHSNISGRTHVLDNGTVLEQVSRVLMRPAGNPFRIALIHSDYPSSRADFADLMAKAEKYPGIEFVPIAMDYAPTDDGTKSMIQQAVEQIAGVDTPLDGYWVTVGPSALKVDFLRVIAERTGLPSVFGQTRESVEHGSLLGLFSSEEINGRAVGRMAAAVLGGATPAAMPVERPPTFVAAINITTAVEMGVTVPSALVELAGPNIFR